MPKLAGWRRTFYIFVCILAIVRILYVGIRGEVDKEYYTSASYNLDTATEIPCRKITETFTCDKDRLNSLEFLFNNIADDKIGIVTLVILKEGDILYQANISLANVNNVEWKKIYVNLDIDKAAKYTITLDASEDCTQVPTVFAVDRGAKEIIDAYQVGTKLSGKVAINFGYLALPGRYDKLSIISLWVILVIIIYVFLCYFKSVRESLTLIYGRMAKSVNSVVLEAVTEILAGIVIINSSGIEFQAPTRVILYIVSLFSVTRYDDKKAYISELINRPVKRVLLILLYIYAAFALVGQRILLYPLTLKLTSAGLFVFCVTIIWFIPVINSFIYYLGMVGKYVFAECGRLRTPVFVLLCVAILTLPALYNLFANNPGISSPDTTDSMISNAQHLHGMYDWHPAFYCMTLRVIQEISNTTYAIIFAQYFFWNYVMMELLLFLRERGMRESLLISTALFSGLNASNFLHLNTIWKDIPYTISMLWALVIVAKLSINYEIYKKKWHIYLELIIAMVGICLYRKNGTVSFVILAVALIFAFRKSLKVWLSVLLTAALVFTIKGPVYDFFEVQDSGKHGIYMGLGQDIMGAYYGGGEVSEDTLKMITKMTGYNNAEYSYTPTWSMASYDVDVEVDDFIKNYIDTFLKNPVIMIRAIIDREDAIWDIFAGQDSVLGCVNYYGTQDGNDLWSENYPKRRYVSLYSGMSAATNYTANTQWIAAIEWRGGLFTLLGMSAILFVIFKKGKRRYLIILAPLLGHIMSLLLSTGWSDFRYFWPLNLMNMTLILLALVAANSKANFYKKVLDESAIL